MTAPIVVGGAAIALGTAAFINRKRIWKFLTAKGLTNYEKQQAVLAKRPIFPTLESIQKGYPTQEYIDYREEEGGKPIVHLNLDCTVYSQYTVTEDSWGVTDCMQRSTKPPAFSALCEQIEVNNVKCYRIRCCEFLMKLSVSCWPYSNPKWQTWSEWMDARFGRGKLSQQERVYWCYMHEMDHFRCYWEYWMFVAEHIFVAINTRFSDHMTCDLTIENIRKNVVHNYLVARRRSAAFDQVSRGLPQAGARYGKLPFNSREKLEWHAIGQWPAGSITSVDDSYYENEINEIQLLEPIENWIKEKMNNPNGLRDLMQLVEMRRVSGEVGPW